MEDWEKKKDKLASDKTFGLKNKNKSSKVQKYVQTVTNQVKGTNMKDERAKLMAKKKEKEAKKNNDDAMKALFAAAITQPKVPKGVDPKSIVCEFFKQATCAKGIRCKFSHDLNAGRKVAKIDLYTDKRKEKEEDKMDDWDQEKLEKVIGEKHKKGNQTDIVCKYFLDAIEKSLYGWFWVCPNGGNDCKYRHALPPGYKFQTRAEREAELKNKKSEISIEEIIEQQRAKLGADGGTPVTAESLAKWKADKAKRKADEIEKKRKESAKKSGGRGLNVLSGRALFTYDPTLFQDDDSADPSADYPQDDDVDEAAQKIDEKLYVKEDASDLNVEDLQ